jgi:hypothetical protein
MNTYTTKRKTSVGLKRIGNWATWWWGISGLWVVWLVWQSLSYYAGNPNWTNALVNGFMDSLALQIALSIILSGWVAGGFVWLQELKRLSIGYGEAFKDLFLTIRK